jgi:hypothetical protein
MPEEQRTASNSQTYVADADNFSFETVECMAPPNMLSLRPGADEKRAAGLGFTIRMRSRRRCC